MFFFSERTTDYENKYRSYVLEILAIVYTLERFRVYLLGISFIIRTDCNAITIGLNKKEINSRINRWAMQLQPYKYKIGHRISERMKHVDALSRESMYL